MRTHPETKERLIYVNDGFTSHIKDMDAQESDALLKKLFRRREPGSTVSLPLGAGFAGFLGQSCVPALCGLRLFPACALWSG